MCNDREGKGELGFYPPGSKQLNELRGVYFSAVKLLVIILF